MSLVLLVVGIVLFVLAGLVAVATASIGVSVIGLVAFGLASFAASFLPLP